LVVPPTPELPLPPLRLGLVPGSVARGTGIGSGLPPPLRVGDESEFGVEFECAWVEELTPILEPVDADPWVNDLPIELGGEPSTEARVGEDGEGA
jgi:hypothetical protein